MTSITIVSGFDGYCAIPELIRSAGVMHRVAVIQHTFKADCPDMYFDNRLWECLLEYALAYKRGAEVSIAQRQGSREEQPNAFITSLRDTPNIDQEPPEYIIVRDSGKIILLIATEYWAYVGGPHPYSDSYTYSLYSETDIAESISHQLSSVSKTNDWDLRSEPSRPQIR